MRTRVFPLTLLAAATFSTSLLTACGTSSVRDQVVYPNSAPIPRAPAHAEQKTNYDGCPGDAEELAPGSICPASAQCYEISRGRRCIVYEK
ncbi:hypothetical protein GNX18_19020 [Microbulbifer sp. SH-1]|uniref:hypothetical protein n=1 Tax=Microbulbifer sp. SH-1 TaxID=2681547 RepID=UPI00140A253F|nr:hypothetical protein [Microbulbifer sp. SH-1]QIL91640.1 hypothetical protein GNX18_19020 [Microbulbifer sp. SH-1]